MLVNRADQPKAPARIAVLAFVLIAAPMLLAGCMSEKDVDLSTYVEQTDPPDVIYNQGLANLNAGRLDEAAKKFAAVDRQHPYSEYARKAIVNDLQKLLAKKMYCISLPGQADTFDLAWPVLSNYRYSNGDRRTPMFTTWVDETKAPINKPA